MSGEFSNSVELGLKLSQRIHYGKDSTPVTVIPTMSRSSPEPYLPSAMMVFAVVHDPEIVDNPDIPSYQPYSYGQCQQPALIPLQMHAVCLEVDCCLDHATISVKGAWRVHCIKTSRRSDCCIAVPMGEKGSILGVEVEVTGRSARSCHTQLIKNDDEQLMNKVNEGDNDRFFKGHVYTLVIPQVEGGSNLSIKATWSQELRFCEGQFRLTVPFSFPSYVNRAGKKICEKEKILLNVNSGIEREVLFRCSSHDLKEIRRVAGKLCFAYEAQVSTWSSSDLNFSYNVASSDLFGGVLLQSPSLDDFDQRNMFCIYLFPGDNRIRKSFKKEVVFMIDTSGSMRGSPLENAKNALIISLSKLNPEDSFNIIAFNRDTQLFSSSMTLATKGAILSATLWLKSFLVADGGTNMLLPFQQVVKMLSGSTSESIPLIFLITDGTVENEREICNAMKGYLNNKGKISPRICTFGIGSYCNHYFLQMLAHIGRGHYDSAYDADSTKSGIQRLFTAASAVILANIEINMPEAEHLESLELFPSHIPDLSSENPLIISGRCSGNFPNSLKICSLLANMSSFVMDLKVQKAKHFALNKVLAKRQIDVLTARTWLSESKEVEDKIARMSIQTGVPSEYTQLILHQDFKEEKATEPVLIHENSMKQALSKINMIKKMDSYSTRRKIIFLKNLGAGFGNLKATADNIPPGTEETSRSSDASDLLVQAASNCCHLLLDRCCCLCCIKSCLYMNNQCAIVVSQICAALACFECMAICFEICECV